jgi:putative ABC transport system permease protein
MSRTYRFLLLAFPAAFRARFGADMEALFEARLSEARGSVRLAGVWAGALFDVIRHAPAERLSLLRSRHSQPRIPRGRRYLMEQFLRDVRTGFRSLVRVPGFTTVAVLTLALGIGANAAVFSVVFAMLLRPLPYAEPDRLVTVWPERNFNTTLVSRVAESVPALESIAGIAMWTMTLLEDGAEPIEVDAAFVSANYFDVLGTRPQLGRTFVPEEALPGRTEVAVLSYDFWQMRYAGDPAVIGRTIRLSSGEIEARTVIGVMPQGHRPIGGDPIAWVPIVEQPGHTVATDPTWWVGYRVARIAPGATRADVEAQLRRAGPALRAESSNMISEEDIQNPTAPPLREEAVGTIRPALLVLTGAVALVLLIACVNVANLLLARGEARAREVHVRRALGATRGRVVRQLLTESLLLAVLGALAGLATGWGLLRVIVAQAPPEFREMTSVTIGAPVLLFTLAVSITASLLFGALPALRAGRAAASDIVREGGKGSVGVRAGGTISTALVALEVALAILLVVSAGLMLRTLRNLYDVDPGFQADGVLTLRPTPSQSGFPDTQSFLRFYDDVLERVRSLPGVSSAAGIQLLPSTTSNWAFPLYIEDHTVPPGATPPSHNYRIVTPGYFETMRIPLMEGRSFTAADRGETKVVIVNRAFATRYWPGDDAVGKRIRVFMPSGEAHAVIGVVGDVRQFALHRSPEPEIYVPNHQWTWQASLSLVVRAENGDAANLASAIRDVVWSLDRDTPISQMEPLGNVVGRSAATARFVALLLTAFGALALVLGAVGVYGVTAFTVARRLPEFGVRVALGARPRDVVTSAVSSGIVPVVIGIALGWAGALASTRLLRNLLYEVSPTDPVTFAAVIGLLGMVGLGALLVPAWRATRVDPISVLHRD